MSSSRTPGVPHPALPLPQGDEDLAVFHAWLQAAIPMAGELGIERPQWEGEQLSWQLALVPNLNDKGTGFGGSLAAQTTLQGWCWLTLWLRQQSREQNVVVAEARQRFLAPVTGDYQLVTTPSEEGGPLALATQLAERGKGRITLKQQVYCGGKRCLEACGQYAVLPDH